MTKRNSPAPIRTVKISRSYFPVVPSSSNGFTGLRAIPWIRLRGVWLEKAGFNVGQSMKVRVLRKRIVIWVA